MFFWNITDTFIQCTILMLIVELKMYIPRMFGTVSCTVGITSNYGTYIFIIYIYTVLPVHTAIPNQKFEVYKL